LIPSACDAYGNLYLLMFGIVLQDRIARRLDRKRTKGAALAEYSAANAMPSLQAASL
jgi:hypothetical protein